MRRTQADPIQDDVVDEAVLERTVERFRERSIILPTFAQLADPTTIPAPIRRALGDVKPDEADPLNLFRVHWHNDADRTGLSAVPGHVVLPPELTGVEAPIVVLLGDRFPMIRAHKVLASYGCLAPRVVTGRFDPTQHRAVWPSTGNYCRGGVAISRLMSCRGVAVLPAGMSRERFDWLGEWVNDPADIIATPGSESNVKEIYDRCGELAEDPDNVILNQFSEFGNHLIHYLCTGAAIGRVFEHLRDGRGGGRDHPREGLTLAAFVSASGSAGTLGAGDHLKEVYGARIVAVEALECPTLLYNGYGEHNIQGIGDKHVPLIHNVENTDVVTAVSDQVTDQLAVVFNTEAGRLLLRRRGVDDAVIGALGHLGLSSICNVVAAVKTAKYLGLGADQAVMTVATDGAEMYRSEVDRVLARDFAGDFDEAVAGAVFARHMLGAGTDHLIECSRVDRDRIFNLGYYTWVEQQGVPLPEFEARRSQTFWRGLRDLIPRWDSLIAEFNARTGVAVP
ncbi:MAG TPA: pyridoxal-5'-phosphate-dependent protein subunit beta [Acidimicrobiales bacterium]|nr:pyridoxal-5'-phosphate-dependent protein subunit beta [Acidimicrobiales bacterium]